MARTKHDREDLMREATALLERAELSVEGFRENVIVGFRKGGAASFFFGPDPVYQFNTENELRRAFRGGNLIKADGRRLVELRRERAAGEVQLRRRPLDEEEANALLSECWQTLGALHCQLAADQFELVAQVPTDADVLKRVANWLSALPQTITIAPRPNVDG